MNENLSNAYRLPETSLVCRYPPIRVQGFRVDAGQLSSWILVALFNKHFSARR